MGMSPEFNDGNNSKTNLGRRKMQDVARANIFIEEIGGTTKVKTMLGAAAAFLRKNFAHEKEPEKIWTERRLRSWWHGECKKVEFWQMIELATAAEMAKREREVKLARARREHAQFMQETASLIEALKRRDPAFYSGEIERLGLEIRRMDMPGTDGE